jgi:glycosyltransferase involved in cell wall biosynthesis
MKLSVVIPVYNEKDTLLEILERVRRVDLPKEIIVVDDFSTDGTREILQKLSPAGDLKILYQPRNQGKGAALRRGFETVAGDFVVIQDADLEYDPTEYPHLLQPILAGSSTDGSGFGKGAAVRDEVQPAGCVAASDHILKNRRIAPMTCCCSSLVSSG